jgi:hypothetical protein
MKMLKIVLVVSLGVVLCSAAIFSKESFRKEIDKLFTGILEGEVDKSYDEFFANTPLEFKKQAVQLIKEQTLNSFSLYGKAINYEFVKQQKYGSSVIRLVYIIKFERLPMTYEFYFYKAASDWKLTNISFSDQYLLLADK